MQLFIVTSLLKWWTAYDEVDQGRLVCMSPVCVKCLRRMLIISVNYPLTKAPSQQNQLLGSPLEQFV